MTNVNSGIEPHRACTFRVCTEPKLTFSLDRPHFTSSTNAFFEKLIFFPLYYLQHWLKRKMNWMFSLPLQLLGTVVIGLKFALHFDLNFSFTKDRFVLGQWIQVHRKFTCENNFHPFTQSCFTSILCCEFPFNFMWTEITLTLTRFSLKSMIHVKNFHSQFSHFTQRLRSEITFTLD